MGMEWNVANEPYMMYNKKWKFQFSKETSVMHHTAKFKVPKNQQ